MNSRNLFLLTLITITGLFLTPPAMADSANLHVTARVLPWVVVSAEQHVFTYRVNKRDLELGYVDLRRAVTVHLKSNLSGDVAISLNTADNDRIMATESGRADFAEGLINVSAAGSRIGRGISREIDCRIVLSEDTREGTYPLHIALAPVI